MGYRSGGAWFICDRCSQKRRRTCMRKEWDGLIVCPECLDPRPPEMTPPRVYPEGLSLPDARRPPEMGNSLSPFTWTNDRTLVVPWIGNGGATFIWNGPVVVE